MLDDEKKIKQYCKKLKHFKTHTFENMLIGIIFFPDRYIFCDKLCIMHNAFSENSFDYLCYDINVDNFNDYFPLIKEKKNYFNYIQILTQLTTCYMFTLDKQINSYKNYITPILNSYKIKTETEKINDDKLNNNNNIMIGNIINETIKNDNNWNFVYFIDIQNIDYRRGYNYNINYLWDDNNDIDKVNTYVDYMINIILFTWLRFSDYTPITNFKIVENNNWSYKYKERKYENNNYIYNGYWTFNLDYCLDCANQKNIWFTYIIKQNIKDNYGKTIDEIIEGKIYDNFFHNKNKTLSIK